MLHEFNFSELVVLSTLVFTCWNVSNSHIFQYQEPILQVCGVQPIKLIVAWLSPDRARKENHKKGLKGNYERLIDFLRQISILSYFNFSW